MTNQGTNDLTRGEQTPCKSSHPSPGSSRSLRRNLSLACNIFVAVFTAIALVMIFTGWGTADNPYVRLEARGLGSLKFFTVLSNLLSGVVSALYAGAVIRLPQDTRRVSRTISVLKLAGTTSVGLTFLTVVVLFRGIWGLGGMFFGANFWFHLVLPLASIATFCFLDTKLDLRIRDTFAATLPMVFYGVAYYANILVNGIGEGPSTNDWYALASWGIQWAPVVFAVMFASTLIVALVLYAANRCARPKDR